VRWGGFPAAHLRFCAPTARSGSYRRGEAPACTRPLHRARATWPIEGREGLTTSSARAWRVAGVAFRSRCVRSPQVRPWDPRPIAWTRSCGAGGYRLLRAATAGASHLVDSAAWRVRSAVCSIHPPPESGDITAAAPAQAASRGKYEDPEAVLPGLRIRRTPCHEKPSPHEHEQCRRLASTRRGCRLGLGVLQTSRARRRTRAQRARVRRARGRRDTRATISRSE
jgi:hypothetical protein